MAKLYGGRWEIIGSQIGTGGQSEVFPARDTVGEHLGTYALKRVKNPKRHDRFRAEVEAIKRIHSPHVIEIIDHSALDASVDSSIEKQFLVMPLLQGGDLGKRAPAFANSIDSVLIVAKQIAIGLAHAHSVQVVHRDVKPGNVVFVDDGNAIQLCDFGICLIQDRPRVTSTDEAVGPWTFMAPELEGGGHLDVTPAADLYALGKLIYFMLSGGRLVARERVDDPEFLAAFAGGERHTDLLSLTRRLLCADPNARIQTAAEVISALERIQSWENRAHSLALSEQTMSALDQFKRAEMDMQSAQAARASLLAQHKQAVLAVCEALRQWLYGELCKLRDAISTAEVTATVQEAPVEARGRILLSGLHRSPWAIPLFELRLAIQRQRDARPMEIAFTFCEISAGATVRVGNIPAPPPREPQLALFPLFIGMPPNEKRPIFISPRNASIPVVSMGRTAYQAVSTLKFSIVEGITILTRFESKDWPHIQDSILRDLDSSVGALLAVLQSGSYSVVP